MNRTTNRENAGVPSSQVDKNQFRDISEPLVLPARGVIAAFSHKMLRIDADQYSEPLEGND
jgi:hypothetical protein